MAEHVFHHVSMDVLEGFEVATFPNSRKRTPAYLLAIFDLLTKGLHVEPMMSKSYPAIVSAISNAELPYGEFGDILVDAASYFTPEVLAECKKQCFDGRSRRYLAKFRLAREKSQHANRIERSISTWRKKMVPFRNTFHRLNMSSLTFDEFGSCLLYTSPSPRD